MKRLFLIILVIILPTLSAAGKYRAKGWYYASFVDGAIGLPSYFSVGLFRGAIGFPPPHGFGIGTAIAERFGPFPINSEEQILGHLPLSIYYVPFANWTKHGKPLPIVYSYFSLNSWLASNDWDESGSYWRLGVGVHSSRFVLPLGFETGFYSLSYRTYSGILGDYVVISSSSFYFAINLTLGAWVGIGMEEIPSPSLQLFANFTDADDNKILSGNEEGRLDITIHNRGAGKARDVKCSISIVEKEFKDKITYNGSIPIGNIESFGSRTINIPIKALSELPKSNFIFKITCSYTAETGEKGTEATEVTVNTAPSTGMIKVAFKNLSSEGLPSWIIPTQPEYADYQVEYNNNILSILNLNTGERKNQSAVSALDAQNKAKDYFLSWDKTPPHIILSSDGGTVNTENVKVSIRLSDDRKLDAMNIYLNDNLFKSEAFTEITETERELSFPLQMGDNTIKFILTDWVGKSDEKVITLTRIRGGTGTTVAGTLPRAEPPPELKVEASPLDGNNVIVGGREEGIKVVVSNNGGGIAKWVRVVLEGDDSLVNTWGKERNLEDIKPGETKTAIFSLLMPTELAQRNARIDVIIKEGRGYSPTVRPSFNFSLLPAEITTKPEEVVEDVDFDIPQGKVQRSNGYALIIGLSKYSNAPAPKYSKNDAEVFSKYASKVFGIANIETLFDEKATFGVIRGKLNDWMKKKNGFKLIYFAGHGVPDPENPKEGDVYLLPYDGYADSKSTLISLKDISELGANPGDTVLVFLDACFSGSEGRTQPVASRPLVVSKIPKTDAIILAAAEGTQPAKEFEEARHGYFTYYTLLGLKGNADANKDGWITTTELYNFVKEKVSDATNNVQMPVLRPVKEIRIGRVR